MDPKVARDIVLSRIGDLGQLKRTCVDLGRKREREMRLTQWLEDLKDDVMVALRQLKASPAFTLVAVLTLALGIGANSAMFAVADATLLRPLPFPDADRLVMVSEISRDGSRGSANPLDFVDWSERNRTFEAMAGVMSESELDHRRGWHRPTRGGTGGDGPVLRRARRQADRRPHVSAQRRQAMVRTWSCSAKDSGEATSAATRPWSAARSGSVGERSP